MSWISATMRAAVRERAAGRCEYCLVSDSDVLIPHEPDHVVAEQHGGETSEQNLALACFHCNRFKGPNLASVDPETRQLAPLFHPRTQIWSEHFELNAAHILGRTPTGRATVFLLRLNAPDRLRLREALKAVRRFPIPQ
jgi:hypothetical protein